MQTKRGRYWPRRTVALLALLAGLLALPGAAFAMEMRNGDSVVVGPGETIDDDLMAAGRTVTIAGTVKGDAYAWAQTVIVTGTVEGDLISAGEQVTVDGAVLGDLRAAGAQVNVNGQVGKNVTVGAQALNLNSNGKVGGSVLVGASSLNAFGPIGRGVTMGGGTLQLAGPVGGKVLAHVNNLTVAPSARVAGGLDYQAEQEASLPPGSVAGPVTFTAVERQEEKPKQSDPLNGLFNLGGLIGLIGSAILGVVLVKLFPAATEQVVETGRGRPLQSFGLGLAILFLTPLVGLLIAITLIGLPLAFGLGLLYGLGLLLAWPAVGLLVGALLALAARRGRTVQAIWLLLLGLVVLHLVTHLPFVGGLIAFLGLTLGLGLVAQVLLRWRRPPRPAGALAPIAAPA